MVAGGTTLPSLPKKKGGWWDLDDCGPDTYPFQSHHLIPKMHLPKHDVCVFLAKKAANSKFKLQNSTDYDTDAAENGEPLPFASNTYQWKKASGEAAQIAVTDLMQEKTKKQLHQGSHTSDDYGEQDALHADEQPGYLGAVDEFLKVVNAAATQHYETCTDCKGEDSEPIEIRPLKSIAGAIHGVSGCMRAVIAGHKRFVSKKAAAYWQKHR
jgi:hypothetical protein